MSPVADVQDEVSVIFATMDRYECAERLLASIRAVYPRMAVLVGDQSKDRGGAKKLARAGATVVEMPFDAGVCATRNALVERVETPYFILCDDDFVWSEETNFFDPLTLLKANPAVAVVGGRLYDIYSPTPSKAAPRHWERYMHLDPIKRKLLMVPLERTQPKAVRVGRSVGYQVDAVLNFALMRRAAFEDGALKWDAQFKSNGEHEDFYLNLKGTPFEVLYCPKMIAYHYSVMTAGYGQLRNRTEGWKLFSKKWGVDHIVDDRWTFHLSTGEMKPSPATFEEFERMGMADAGLPELPPGHIGVTPDGKLYISQQSLPAEQPVPALPDHVGNSHGIEMLQRQIVEIRSSNSWKVTAPARMVATAWRKLFDRQDG